MTKTIPFVSVAERVGMHSQIQLYTQLEKEIQAMASEIALRAIPKDTVFGWKFTPDGLYVEYKDPTGE